MIDILPFLAKQLRPVCPTQSQFPDVRASFPVVTLCELGNSADTVLDGEERLCEVDIQIDVWDNAKTAAKCKQLAAEVSAVMTRLGFRRYFGNEMPDPAVPQRYSMRFQGVIDEHTGMVYWNN